MTWLRMELTEERRRTVNEERSAHPNPRIRERMLVVWLLRNGTTRQYAARIVGVRGYPASLFRVGNDLRRIVERLSDETSRSGRAAHL